MKASWIDARNCILKGNVWRRRQGSDDAMNSAMKPELSPGSRPLDFQAIDKAP
jgi:hypothetical protein